MRIYLISTHFISSRYQRSRSVTRELNKAIKGKKKKKKKPSTLDTLLPIHNRGEEGKGIDQPPPISSISIFFLSPDATGSNHTSNRFPFNSLFLLPPSSFHHPTEKCWDLSSIFSLLPLPPFFLFFSFLFISFHLVHRAISEIDFSYPVDVGCT